MTDVQKYHCCIPGCTAYDTLGKFVPLPYENYWREQWLEKIPRKDWVVDASTIACKKHFPAPLTFSTKAIKDNTEKKTFTFVSTKSVPTMLPRFNHSRVPSKCRYYPESMFELFHRDIQVPESLRGLENPNSDYLGTFYFFKMAHPQRLHMVLQNTWMVATSTDDVIFYTADFSEVPRILCSIKVDWNLQVTVTLAGRTMDPLDLTWILPVNCQLNRWSQLQLMLTIFGR